jgi:hypothetical protein
LPWSRRRTDPSCQWVKRSNGQARPLEKIISFFSPTLTEVVMAGGITRRDLQPFRSDQRAIDLLSR